MPNGVCRREYRYTGFPNVRVDVALLGVAMRSSRPSPLRSRWNRRTRLGYCVRRVQRDGSASGGRVNAARAAEAGEVTHGVLAAAAYQGAQYLLRGVEN